MKQKVVSLHHGNDLFPAGYTEPDSEEKDKEYDCKEDKL